MRVQRLGRAGALAVGAAQKALAQASATYRAQRLLEQLQQPQLHQRAWPRLLLGVLAQPRTLQTQSTSACATWSC